MTVQFSQIPEVLDDLRAGKIIVLVDDEEDRIAQAIIRSSANRSLAVLEKAFIRNGSGRYLVLRGHFDLTSDEASTTIQAQES